MFHFSLKAVLFTSLLLPVVALSNVEVSAQDQTQARATSELINHLDSEWMVEGQSEFRMIFERAVRIELGITREQMEKMYQLEQEFAKDLSQGFNREMSPEDRSAGRIREIQRQVNDDYWAKVDGILLPVQKQRLQQIFLRNVTKTRGTLGALMNDQVAQSLDIDHDQKIQLQKRAREIRVKLDKDILALRQQADRDLLDELTNSQREQFEQMLGDKFELKPPNHVDESDVRSDDDFDD